MLYIASYYDGKETNQTKTTSLIGIINKDIETQNIKETSNYRTTV